MARQSSGEADLARELLSAWDRRLPWSQVAGTVAVAELLQGSPDTGLSIILGSSAVPPSKSDLLELWSARAKRTVDPVLVCVAYLGDSGVNFAIFGPDKDAVPLHGVDRVLAERFLYDALTIDSPVRLSQEVHRRLGSMRTGSPGFRNEGLFASHVLSQQPHSSTWPALCGQSQPLVGLRGDSLLTGLGYALDVVPDGIVLREQSSGHRRAAAVVLTDGESMDNPIAKFHGTTAIAHGLALAQREGVPWLILLGGSVARLYSADPDVGVGRKGQTQTFVEVDLALLTDSTSGYLTLLFAPDALVDNGTVAALLISSSKYATGLSERLRDRIYEDVVPSLAVAVATRMQISSLPAEQQRAALDEAYHQSMLVLFRMLFVAYAEDRGLLPLDLNEAYTSNALKTLARRILEEPEKGFSETSTSLWTDLVQIWDVIDQGDLEGMGVPAYNGGLFTRDPAKNQSGAAIYDLRMTNAEIGPVIRGLMIDTTPDGYLGLVDFRSMDVREFGTIYEGLLESGLAIADVDLTVDANDTYVPAGKRDQVWVASGAVYFHSRSGTRKATGSYFTKPFAVQHLLDHALEPAIDTHLDRVKALLSKGSHTSAADALFDFRVADLAMGSAHFLVAAIDRIEARFSAFIAGHPMPEVQVQLDTVRRAAATQLGVPPLESGIDDGMLLRRQIARRCVYGIDINEVAVELARLAVWIHTFVPGLPLSFLNHGLIHGNSLTGVGTVDEIVQALSDAEERETRTAGQSYLLPAALADFINRAGEHLDRLAALADASISDVNAAAAVQADIEAALTPLTALCDLITAERTTRHLKKTDPGKILLSAGGGNLFTATDAASLEAAILTHPHLAAARQIASDVHAAHLPTGYPEVFQRDPAGFDVILGNPPWDEVTVEAPKYWRRYYPGLLGMKPDAMKKKIKELIRLHPFAVPAYEADVAEAERYRKALLALPYPGLGTGDVDFYQVFAWRSWQLLARDGRLGMVFPRSLLNSAGTAKWRECILATGLVESGVFLINTGKWVFDEVDGRYSIVLLALAKREPGPDAAVALAGPFHSQSEFDRGRNDLGRLPARQLGQWATGAAFPLLGSERSAEVFRQMREHPRLDRRERGWDFRPVAELHATNDRKAFDAGGEKEGRLAVYTGSSFDIWTPDTGEYYAWADPTIVTAELQRKRLNQIGHSKSAFHGLPEDWARDPATLPMHKPRIAFRDITNATNTRTVLAALIPGGHPLVNTAPYLARLDGDEQAEAYLLGVLSSIPLDWYARRYVELHVNLHIANGLPIPDAQSGDPLRDRVAEVAGRLAAVDDRYADWANAVGVKVGTVKTQVEKDALVAELDALVCLLYGLSREQVSQVFATFHRGWDYHARLNDVLAHFDQWTHRVAESGH